MGGGEAGEEGETVDSGRPSSPKSQAQAKREEEKMTEIEAIIKKEQQVSKLHFTNIYAYTKKNYPYTEWLITMYTRLLSPQK